MNCHRSQSCAQFVMVRVAVGTERTEKDPEISVNSLIEHRPEHWKSHRLGHIRSAIVNLDGCISEAPYSWPHLGFTSLSSRR
jgi:hypothetical protein